MREDLQPLARLSAHGVIPPGPHVLCGPGVHSSSRCRLDWLHDVFQDVFTDLKPHTRPDTSRESVVEAGPDASICNFLGKGRHVGPTVGYAGGRRAGYGDLRDIRGSERRLDDTCDAAAEDAMRAWVFR